MLRMPTLVAATVILGCPSSPCAYARAQAPGLRKIQAGGVSFVYRTRDFAGVHIEKVKKKTIFGVYGPAEGVGESPQHYCFHLKDKRPLPALDQGPRYFFPTNSFICAYPLQDATVKNFRKAYTPLSDDAAELRKLLRDHPAVLEHWRKIIPDFPELDGYRSIIARFQYLKFRSGSGVLFLTQYSNESEPNPANNEELTLLFQGLTQDGRYYVSARLAITNPSLPRGIDFTSHIKRDADGNYLKNDDKKLDRLPGDSFWPSMNSLKAMLSSIKTG